MTHPPSREFVDQWLKAMSNDKALPKSARFAGEMLARYVAINGRCKLSYSEMATQIGISRSGAREAMTELVKRGWFGKLREPSAGKANEYQMVYPIAMALKGSPRH